MGLARRLARDARGGVGLIGAAGIGVGVGCLALAVDLGQIYTASRELQGIADAAALSAAGNPAAPRAAAQAAIAANGAAGVTLALMAGRYVPDPARAADARFAAGGAPADAARVTLTRAVPLAFGIAALGRDHLTISRSATAARTDLASFSIGSRLAALDGGLANALLSALTGSTVSLSVMDHQALLGTEVDLFAFSDALRTSAGVQAASFDQALSTRIKPATALSALAVALDRQGSGAAAAAVRRLATAANPREDRISLDRLLNLGPIGAQDRAAPGQAIAVSTFDLARGTLELANANRQLALDLGAGIPGIAATKVTLAVGDRVATSPWLAVTDHGDPVIRTAQSRLYIEATVAPAAALAVTSVRLPIYVELAEAEARLTAISCGANGATRSVSLSVRPSPGHVAIADVAPTALANHRSAAPEAAARIASAPLVSVTGQARIDLANGSWQAVAFDEPTIAARGWRTVSSGSLAQGVVGSLVSRLSLNVSVAGLGLSSGAIGQAVGATLTPVAPALDGLVNRLTGLLGIHVGQADVRINGVRCGQARLVG